MPSSLPTNQNLSVSGWLNQNTLVELRQIGDADFLKQLFNRYLEDTQERLSELERSVNQGNWDQMGRAAHAIKGSSANLGVTHYVEICRQLQELGQANIGDGAAALVQRLQDDFQSVRQALEKELG